VDVNGDGSTAAHGPAALWPEQLRRFEDLLHVTVEVHRCTDVRVACTW